MSTAPGIAAANTVTFKKPVTLLWRSQLFWITVILWLAVIASSLGVVYLTYDVRVKFNELESLRRQQNELQVTWGQYLLEESTWAAWGRVERLAREQLSMEVPALNRVVVVSLDED